MSQIRLRLTTVRVYKLYLLTYLLGWLASLVAKASDWWLSGREFDGERKLLDLTRLHRRPFSVIFDCYFVKYCDEYVCLSVCLSAIITQKPQGRTLPNFLCMLAVTMTSSFLAALRYMYVKYFLFLDKVMLFAPWGQLARFKHEVVVRRSSPGGGTSETSDNYSDWWRSPECITEGEFCYLRLRCFKLQTLLCWRC